MLQHSERGRPEGFRIPYGPTAMERIESLLDKILAAAPTPEVISAVDQIADICAPYMETTEQLPGIEYDLTPGEAKILALFLSRRGKICSRDALFSAAALSDNSQIKTLDVHICRMRQKLPKDKYPIETIWGRGYRLLPENGVAA